MEHTYFDDSTPTSFWFSCIRLAGTHIGEGAVRCLDVAGRALDFITAYGFPVP